MALGMSSSADVTDAPQVHVHAGHTCYGRYTLYVESKAYVSNLRQKMATGALVLAVSWRR